MAKKKFNLTEALRGWRKDRNITNIDRETYVKQIIEELFELYGLEKEAIDKNTKQLFDSWFKQLECREVGVETLIDGAQDIVVFSDNFIELNGYDSDKVSEEVFLEINSREQDPTQKTDWEKNGASGKWKKNPLQNPETLYKADFDKCKL